MLLYLESQSPELTQSFVNTAKMVGTNEKKEQEQEQVEEIDKTEKKEEEITIYNKSEEIIRLNASGWVFQDTNLDGEYETDGLKYYYDGFTIERNKNYITRIIFNENYKTEVVSGIYVGMDFSEVKKVLGTPSFENEQNNMIGYATKNLYLCIYENEIAVYQNEYYSNVELEEMILKYYKGEYTGTRNEFSKYIRNKYEDFNFTSDEEKNIYLTSLVRGIIIKLDDDISVEIFKEYDNSNVLKQNMDENITFSNEYIVEKMEVVRNSEK